MSLLDVISGKRRGLGPSLVRCGLTALEPFYIAGIATRNLAYDFGVWPFVTRRAALPVISIGNLTTGGTGKTPMVAWVAKHLQQLGRRPVLLSRGYRSLDGQENDEKRLLDQLCPNVPHLQNPDRVHSAKLAAEQDLGDVLILDDGFQHRRLHRDLDIVLIDALNPWGHGRLLPRGLLREPIKSLRRADLVVITRVESVDEQRLRRLADEIAARTGAPCVASRFVPTGLVACDGTKASLETLRHSPCAAFCGIGNPSAFQATLTVLIGPSLCAFRSYPDHHHYSERDLSEITDWGRDTGAKHLITTRKDLVKIPNRMLGPCRLWALDIELDLGDNKAVVKDAIANTFR